MTSRCDIVPSWSCQIKSDQIETVIGDSTTRALLVIFPPKIVIEGIRCSDSQPGMALGFPHISSCPPVKSLSLKSVQWKEKNPHHIIPVLKTFLKISDFRNIHSRRSGPATLPNPTESPCWLYIVIAHYSHPRLRGQFTLSWIDDSGEVDCALYPWDLLRIAQKLHILSHVRSLSLATVSNIRIKGTVRLPLKKHIDSKACSRTLRRLPMQS